MRFTRVTEVVLVAAATLAASLVFTWPLVLDPIGTLPAPSDSRYNAWVLGWVAERTLSGLRGVWDAPVFFPYRNTLAFAEPLLGIGIPLAPLYWLGSSANLLHNVAVWASFAVAGSGGYALGRELTGSRAAAVICGAVAAFVPFRASHLSHIQVLMGAWLWWAAWSVHEYFRRPRAYGAARTAVLFLLLGQSSLYWVYIGALPLIAIAAVEGWQQRVPLSRLSLHAAIASAIAASAFVPVATRMRALTQPESAVATVDSVAYNADLLSYISVPRVSVAWRAVLPHGGGEADLFPGAAALACAAMAFAWRRRTHAVGRGAGWTWPVAYATLALIGAVLSLGETVTLGGHAIVENPLVAWLSGRLPGFAQLRTLSRFALVVQLAVSALAALGVAAWLRTRSPSRRTRIATAAVLSTVVFLEGLSVPAGVFAFSPYADPGGRRVAHWLSQHRGGAVVELPLDGWAEPDFTMVFQSRALLHGHPIAQGVSRYVPPLPRMLGDPDSPLTRPERVLEAPAFLRALGVRFVVIHQDLYSDRALGARIREAFVRATGGAAVEFPGVAIVDVGEEEKTDGRPAATDLESSQLTIASSSAGVERMLDGDSDTRWQTADPQQPGDGFDITLASPRAVTGLRLVMAATRLSEHPRVLTVELAQPDGSLVTVFSDNALPALGHSLRRDPLNPGVEVAWPARVTQRMRVRQTGSSNRWHWSVSEVRVMVQSTPQPPALSRW